MTDTADRPLAELQAWMQYCLVKPDQANADDVSTVIAASERLTSSQQLAIYQRSYYSRLLTCMADQFPALQYALGSELFDDLATQFLRDRPSQSYTLYDLGERLPRYLDQTRPDQGADRPRETWIDFMVDLATFERQLFVLFDAPGAEGQTLATSDSPDVQLVLQPAFDLGHYRFDVPGYYHGVKQRRNPELPDLEPSAVALVRRDYLTHTHPITDAQLVFLRVLHTGGTIDDAIAALAEHTAAPLDGVWESWRAARGVRDRWIDAGFFLA